MMCINFNCTTTSVSRGLLFRLGGSRMKVAKTLVSALFASLFVAAMTYGQAVAQQQQRPNIVVIWGDDIGQSNVSAYSRGMMGYQTPNIDRLAGEGVMFTDYYAEQSCTAGRASFLTGQSGLRTGMTKVGLPGATLGLQKEDPTIAELLKPLGYATGQFGKNHLGDRNEFLPTVHGFDEFYGNLYHLNAEEEPELPDYPKDPAFKAKYGPRGVLDCKASDRDDPTVDARFGKMGNLAVAGDAQVSEKLRTGYKIGDATYKVHLDGYNLVPYLTGQATKSPRESFFYINDDQQVVALRYDNWKIVFMEQRANGQLLLWANSFHQPAGAKDLQSPHRPL
jgi:arylsulfatase A-like enzyme